MTRLKLLPRDAYLQTSESDPLRFYYWPILGRMYRQRVEMCLEECSGGERILEIGFGCGLTFVNHSEKYKEIHGLDLSDAVTQVQQRFAEHGIATSLRQGNVLAMPYADNTFDTVLLISILEHLKPEELPRAFAEIARVTRPGGQVIYGVPVDRPLMTAGFRLLGYDIHRYHFSTERQVADAAGKAMQRIRLKTMRASLPFLGAVYEVGHFRKNV